MKIRFNIVTVTLMLMIPIFLAFFVFLAPQFNDLSSSIKIAIYIFTVVTGEIILLLTSIFQSRNVNINLQEDLQIEKRNKYKIIFSVFGAGIVSTSILLFASFESVTMYKVVIFSFISLNGIYLLLGEPITLKKSFTRKKQITYGLILFISSFGIFL